MKSVTKAGGMSSFSRRTMMERMPFITTVVFIQRQVYGQLATCSIKMLNEKLQSCAMPLVSLEEMSKASSSVVELKTSKESIGKMESASERSGDHH